MIVLEKDKESNLMLANFEEALMKMGLKIIMPLNPNGPIIINLEMEKTTGENEK